MPKRNWTKAADKHPEGFLKGDLVSEVDLALLEAEKSFAARSGCSLVAVNLVPVNKKAITRMADSPVCDRGLS